MKNGLIKTSIASLLVLAFSAVASASDAATQVLNDSVLSFSNKENRTPKSAQGNYPGAPLQATSDKDGPAGIENLGYAISVLQQLQVDTEITPETTDLFGEQIDIGTGGLTFVQTDVSIPGNSSLPVAISRKLLDPKDRYNGTREFGLWSLDLPHISTSLIRALSAYNENPDYSGSWGQNIACSGRLKPGPYYGDHTNVTSYEYWNGDSIYIPGKGNSAINGFNGNFDRKAKENWKIDCFDTANGYEGFIVTTDNGTKYTFGQLRLIRGIEVTKPWPTLDFPPEFDRHGKCTLRCDHYYIYHAFMLVTKVEDRFGNWVEYDYTDHTTSSGSKKLLTSITANDGRSISLNYRANDIIIDNIVTNGRTWQYNYNEGYTDPEVDYLTSITLPDNRSWGFSGYSPMYVTEGVPSDFVESAIDPAAYCMPLPRATTLTITHPDGLSGTFETSNTVQGRTEVPKDPLGTVLPDGTINTYRVKRCYSALSISSKTLTHPSGETYTWNYDYSENPGSFEDQGDPDYVYDDKVPIANLDSLGLPAVTVAVNGYELADLKSTTITAPDNSKAVHYFVRRYDWLEGAEVFVDYYDTDGSTLLKRIQKDYQQGQSQGEYSLQSASSANQDVRLTRQLLTQQITFQNGNTYTTAYSDFNDYEVARKTSESNNLPDSRSKFTKQGFRHDTTNWVLNQPTTVSISDEDNETKYKVVSETTYHDASTSGGAYDGLNLPYETKRFGTWVSRNVSYHSNGLVKKTEFNQLLKKADGTDGSQYRYRDIVSYHRGQPTEIQYPARYSDTAVVKQKQMVDDNGWVERITDLNNVVFNYGYTDMGRLQYVESPVDTVAWLDTWFDWSYDQGGALVRTMTRCTLSDNKDSCTSPALSVTTTYDGLLRAVLTRTTDEATQTQRYLAQAYNPWNKLTYKSYPASTEAATATAGYYYSYDGLQRLKTTSQTGGGTQTTEYLAGNKIKVSEPVTASLFNETTTTFLAYGAPSYEQAIHIDSEESVSTSLAINVFGDITQITQTGPGAEQGTEVSLTEYRAYDALHYLCKVSRQDVGTKVYQHSSVGETTKVARGVSGGSNTDCLSTADASKDINIKYDNLGGAWELDYQDANTPDINYELDNIGNLKTLTAGTGSNAVVQSYAYNKLYLPTSETLTVQGKRIAPGASLSSLVYGYNTLGQVDALTYPDGVKVAFAPNAFGEPTEAKRVANSYIDAYTYVSGAAYYATGALDSFNYSNGITHKTTLNSRKLPYKIRDASAGGTEALDYTYSYDYALNVTSIVDGKNASFSLTDLSYDRLNRLTSTTGGTGIGSSSVTYDGLGNILTYSSKDRNFEYDYAPPGSGDTRKNLLRAVDYAGTTPVNFKAFVYDSRGNVTGNGFNNFTYNMANQMVAADGSSYVYDGHNRRVSKTNSDGTEYSLYNLNGTLLYRETPQGGVNYIYLGSRLVAKDGVIAETSGNQHYRPFGESIEGETDDVGYTGHKFDKEIGLSYMQARYYDPTIGRFYSNDPVGFRDVHSFNRYAYANNNPYKYTDPDGKRPKPRIIPLRPTSSPPGGMPSDMAQAYGHSGSSGSSGVTFDFKRTSIYKAFDAVFNESADPVDGILEDASEGRKTKGRAKIHDKTGGMDQANEDFDSIVDPDSIESITDGSGDEGRRGTLNDGSGRTAIVRPNSTDGRPTVEIQQGKNRIKIRYEED